MFLRQSNSPHVWKPKIHYRVHNSPSFVPIMSQTNHVHALPSHQRSILTLSSLLRLGLPSGSFLQFSPPNPCTHFPSPIYRILLHSLTRLIFGDVYESRTSLPMHFSSLLLLALPNISSAPSTNVLLVRRDTILHSHTKQQTNLQFCVSYLSF